MKAYHNLGFVCFIALSVASVSAAPLATVPPAAALSLTRTNSTTMNLNLINPGNQVWVVQSSSNLTSWTEVDSLKVFNGAFNRSYTNAAGGNLFYRVLYDEARQTI